MSKRKLTDKDKVHVRLLYGRGAPIVDIAKKFNVSRWTVDDYLKKTQAKRDECLQFAEGESKSDKIKELMKKGYSPGEIARIFGEATCFQLNVLPSEMFNLGRLHQNDNDDDLQVSEETALAWEEINKDN